MNKFSTFVMANNFSDLLPPFVKEVWCLPTLLIVKVAKNSEYGPTLITLVSKEAIAARAWVSRSPTSYTQILFP